jgi:hypothetical protein
MSHWFTPIRISPTCIIGTGIDDEDALRVEDAQMIVQLCSPG